MGTRFEVVLDGSDPARTATVGEHVLGEIMRWHDRLSLFKRDSFLTYLNERAHVAEVPLEPELFDLLSMCAGVHADSGGAFDPTVAPLMRTLGLHDGSTAPEGGRAAGMAAVVLDPDRRTVRFSEPGVALDLGSVAKGFALDLAAGLIRSFGIERALIHGGTSSIVAIGAAPRSDGGEGEAGWRIALGPGEDALVLSLSDGALSYSAPSGRSVETPDGRSRLTHILDPRTGEPASRAVFCAAVASAITGNAVDPWPATRCEAWSTALVVLAARPAAMPDTLTSVLVTEGAGGVGTERHWSVVGPHRPFISAPQPPTSRVPSGPRC